MENTLLGVGAACVIAAIVGGGLKAFGAEIPVLNSVRRQVLLAIFGGILIVGFFATNPMQSFKVPAAGSNSSDHAQTPSTSGSAGIGEHGQLIRFASLRQLSLADVPREAFVPLARTGSLQDLRDHLDRYPALELTHNTLTIQDGGAPGQSAITIFLSSLRIVDDSVLFIRHRNVTLVVGVLEMAQTRIGSFPLGEAKAAAGRDATGVGEPGGNGANGAPAGSLSIYAVERKVAQVEVDLAGQDGGNGGQGGPGVQGSRGRAGQSGSDHLLDCARGPGDGERGGVGSDGAKGGKGGDGGDAGAFSIYQVESASSPERNIISSSRGGAPGQGGSGGPGGRGGPGGPRGSQTTYCHGGSDGPEGPPGNNGPRGEDGKKGSDGAVRQVAPLPFDRFPDFAL